MNKILKMLFLVSVMMIMQITSWAARLSDKAQVSVLTCAPGNQAYSVYGHSAIRIKDPLHNYDLVFHYGLFDFDSPHFIYRFAKGETDYKVGVYKFENFLLEFQYEKREVQEQVLHLERVEKQRIFDYLLWNIKPENRKYRYNFFFDNCATRIRDVITEGVEGGVLFQEDGGSEKTFRELIKEYHERMPWLNFGVDFLVAAPADEIASMRQEMFLPDYLMRHLGYAVKGDGSPLVAETHQILKGVEPEEAGPFYMRPFFVFLLLSILIIYLSFMEVVKGKKRTWLDVLVFGVNGMIGLLVLWFATVSEHPAMHPNYNLLWALPLNLLPGLLWPVKKWRKYLRFYFPVITVWCLLFFVAVIFIPQYMHPVFYLFALLLLARSSVLFYRHFYEVEL